MAPAGCLCHYRWVRLSRTLQAPNISRMIAYIEAQGSLLLMKVLGGKSRPFGAASKRGRIKGFSAKSRLRMLRFLARLRMKNVRATFITLTFKGYPSNAEAKRCLHAFMSHISRTFPKASACWRMEYQKRGSIHFHLLCFNLPFWNWEELLETWKRITVQDTARVDIRLVRSRKGVMFYVSKYIAKVSKASRKTFFIFPPYLHAGRKWRKGRYWGYHNKKLLPFGEVVTGVLTDRNAIKKLSKSAWEMIGVENKYNSLSFHVFADHALSIARRWLERHGRSLYEWEYTLRDHTHVKPAPHPYTEHFSFADLEIPKVSALGRPSRSRSARSVQPCTADWMKRSSFLDRQTGELLYLH